MLSAANLNLAVEPLKKVLGLLKGPAGVLPPVQAVADGLLTIIGVIEVRAYRFYFRLLFDRTFSLICW
jgi:hypothetical protein